MYRTAKMCAEDITKFARELSKEQVVSQVMEFAHVRSLTTFETKNRLLDRFKAAIDAAIEYRDAVEEKSGIEDARNKVTFDSVLEDESVQDIASVLDLLLNAKVEYNRKESVTSQPISARSTPINVFRQIKGFCYLQERIQGCYSTWSFITRNRCTPERGFEH